MIAPDPEDEPFLRALAGAVLVAPHVDWESLQASLPRAEFREIVRQFRDIRAILDAQKNVTHVPGSAVCDPSEAAELPCQSWGHLLLQEHVASGSFGDVYRAWDPNVARVVALKLLRRSEDDGPAAVEEARLLARVRHPHVVTVYGAARIEGTVGLWMEFVNGRTLATLVLDNGAMAARDVVELGVKLCDAVAAVHRAGLLHRDIKAQNVMLADDGRVVLMDFGAGRDLREAGAGRAGTPMYVAPELRRGAPCSPRSDVYSIGVLLLFLVSGTLFGDADTTCEPPGGCSRSEVLRRLGPLGRVLTCALADAPENRFASAADLGKALGRLAPAGARRRWPAYGLCVTLLLVGALSLERSKARGGTTSLGHLEKQWQFRIPQRARIPADDIFSFGYVAPSGVLAASGGPGTAVLTTVALGSRTRQVWVRDPLRSGHAETPVLAADGQRVAYVWYRAGCNCAELRLADANGTVTGVPLNTKIAAASLGPGTSDLLPAVITEDARRFQLGLVDVTLGTFAVVATLARAPAGFSLSPDGRLLAYDTPSGPGPGAGRDVRVIDLASRLETTVAGTASDERLPYWTPDAQTLVFLRREDSNALVGVSFVDGRWSEPATLREGVGVIRPYGFTATGDFVYEDQPGPGDVQISVVSESLDTAPLPTPISRLSGAGGAMPAWSPDGLSVAWVGDNSMSQTSSLLIRTLATGVDRRVPGHLDGLVFPAWSPTGSRIAAWGLEPLTRTLQIIDLSTGNVTELSRTARPRFETAWGLAWRGSDHVLIQEDHESISQVDVRTGEKRRVYTDSSRSLDSGLAVSPDGKSVAFVSMTSEVATLKQLSLADWKVTAVWSAPTAAGASLGQWHPTRGTLLVSQFAGGQNVTGERELWELSLSPVGRRKIGITAPFLFYFSVSPEGDRVAFQSGIPGSEMWILPSRPADH